MLFSEGNHNCPSCEKSGRCTLQAVAYEVDMMVSRFPYQFPERVTDHASESIWLERDRCIFCQRCVEFVRDRETGKKIFSISGRGTNARIEIDVELANAMPPEQVREAVDICPVGTIIEKQVGYDDPIGERSYDVESIRDRALEGGSPVTTLDTKSIASHELPATRLDPELAAKRAEKIKVSMISLCGCWGCTLSFLDIDERTARTARQDHHSAVARSPT